MRAFLYLYKNNRRTVVSEDLILQKCNKIERIFHSQHVTYIWVKIMDTESAHTRYFNVKPTTMYRLLFISSNNILKVRKISV